MFRLIISEKSRDPYGRVLENLGSYNPHSKELAVKEERVNYWLSQGAQMTATINNLLVEKKIISGDKVKASKAGRKNKKAKQDQPKAEQKDSPATSEAKQPAAETVAPLEKPEENAAEEQSPVAAESDGADKPEK